MATREIKTTIALDGEQKFKQALSAATREMRVMESELKAVSAAYDTNGNSAEYFAAKQANLRDQISQQRQIIQALERAVEDAAQAYGESSSQVDGYTIRLNNARTRMSRLEKQLEETDREVEELGRDSIRAGRQLEDGIGEGAESAERSVRDLVNTMQEDISSIRTSSAFTAVSGLWDMASGAFGAVSGFVDSTQEYRRQLSFLENATLQSPFEFSYIEEKLKDVQEITADSTSAMEGLRGLLNVDMNERQYDKAVENMLGAVIQFKDIDFQTLASDFQETIATGQATGQFAELLERLGEDVEEFNGALANSPTLAGDVDAALAQLSANGLSKMYEKYKENNREITEHNRNVADLEAEWARLGGTLSDYIITPLRGVLANVLKEVNDTVDQIEEYGRKPLRDKIDASIETRLEKGIINKKEAEEIKKAFDMYAGGLAMIDVGNIVKQGKEGLKNILSGMSESRKEMSDWITEGFVSTSFAEDGVMKEIGEQAGRDYSEGLQSQIKAATDALAGGYDGQAIAQITGQDGQALRPIGMRENWEEELAAIVASAETAVPTVQAAGETVGTALSTGFEESTSEVEDAAEDAGESAGEAFESSAAQFTTLARMRGVEYGRAFGDGIASQYGYVAANASRLAAVANAAFGGAKAGVAAGAAAGAAASGNITAVLNLDGRTFARVTAPFMATALSHD